MIAVFLVVMGMVSGFGLSLIARQILKGFEAREAARIAREKARDE